MMSRHERKIRPRRRPRRRSGKLRRREKSWKVLERIALQCCVHSLSCPAEPTNGKVKKAKKEKKANVAEEPVEVEKPKKEKKHDKQHKKGKKEKK